MADAGIQDIPLRMTRTVSAPAHGHLPGRRTIVSGLALLPLAWSASIHAACPRADVLLICPSGTVKSAIARELLKRRAAERGVAVHVWSRGLKIADHVTPELAARLKADGLDPRAEPPRPLTAADLTHTDIVIAFDEAAQAPGLEHARVWDIPGFQADSDAAKAALAAQTERLLAELQARHCPG